MEEKIEEERCFNCDFFTTINDESTVCVMWWVLERGKVEFTNQNQLCEMWTKKKVSE